MKQTKYHWKQKKLKMVINGYFLYFHNDFFVIIISTKGQFDILRPNVKIINNLKAQ